MTKCKIRTAQREDCALILELIKALAVYEKMEDLVVADTAMLEEWIFDKHGAEVAIAESEGKTVGFVLYFHNFSTFLGRSGTYIEDLFVYPEYRGCGFGKALIKHVAALTKNGGCGRLEWSCLDWNKPSIDFYLSLGAQPLDGWTTYRVTGEALDKLAE